MWFWYHLSSSIKTGKTISSWMWLWWHSNCKGPSPNCCRKVGNTQSKYHWKHLLLIFSFVGVTRPHTYREKQTLDSCFLTWVFSSPFLSWHWRDVRSVKKRRLRHSQVSCTFKKLRKTRENNVFGLRWAWNASTHRLSFLLLLNYSHCYQACLHFFSSNMKVKGQVLGLLED